MGHHGEEVARLSSNCCFKGKRAVLSAEMDARPFFTSERMRVGPERLLRMWGDIHEGREICLLGAAGEAGGARGLYV